MRVIMQIDEDMKDMRVFDDFSSKLMKLVDAGFSEIVIDFGNIKYISSLALGTIFSSHQKMEQVGRKLSLVNVSEELKKMLSGTKFSSVLHIDA